MSNVGTLSPVEFERCRQELAPSPEEAWRGLPWEISLHEARRTAARAKKPILMVVWSGHPLGCT
jgi:hypothetical protein